MATSDSTTKQCSRCDKVLPATPEFFYRNVKAKDGFQTFCKTCQSQRKPLRKSEPINFGDGTIGIVLTKGFIAIVDEIDIDLAYLRWKANVIKGRVYATRCITKSGKETAEYLHRVIYARIVDRDLDRHELVDHWDNEPRNNRRGNLRLADHSTNGANRKMNIHNTTSYKGTAFKGTSWYAVLKVREKLYSVGGFATEKEAHAKYCEMAAEHFGEFARFE